MPSLDFLPRWNRWFQLQKKSSVLDLKDIKAKYRAARDLKRELEDLVSRLEADDDPGLLLEQDLARFGNDPSNTRVADDNDEAAIRARATGSTSPRRAAGNALVGVGSPTGPLMDRGKSGLTREQGLDLQRRHEAVQKYIEGLGTREAMMDDGLVGLPMGHPMVAMAITEGAQENQRAFLTRLGHTPR
jgi:hypothetical protein